MNPEFPELEPWFRRAAAKEAMPLSVPDRHGAEAGHIITA